MYGRNILRHKQTNKKNQTTDTVQTEDVVVREKKFSPLLLIRPDEELFCLFIITDSNIQ